MSSNLTSQQKGDSLEHAVKAIESTILSMSPGLKESNFLIEGKKILVYDGVRHEIDLYVSASIADGYDTVFIFECKNWKNKIGKNEIIIFSEKVVSVNAQRGFFVATGFTADAKAQAQKDPRLVLLLADEVNPALVEVPGRFHGVQIGKMDAKVFIKAYANSQGEEAYQMVDFSGSSFLLEGEITNLNEFLDSWSNAAKDRRTNNFPSATMSDGSYELEFSEKREFEKGQAILDDHDIESIEMTGIVEVHVCKAVIKSVFDVEARGRFVNVELLLPDFKAEVDFVQL